MSLQTISPISSIINEALLMFYVIYSFLEHVSQRVPILYSVLMSSQIEAGIIDCEMNQSSIKAQPQALAFPALDFVGQHLYRLVHTLNNDVPIDPHRAYTEVDIKWRSILYVPTYKVLDHISKAKEMKRSLINR